MGESSPPTLLQIFLDAHPEITFVRFQVVDYSAIVRVRVLTKAYALSLASNNQCVTTPGPLQTASMIDGSYFMEDFDTGGDEMWADWETLRVCGWRKGTASVMCRMKECGALYGKGFLRCPRTRLRQLMDSTKEKHGIDFLVGVEVEFVIMHPGKDGSPPKAVTTDENVYSTASLRNEYSLILDEIVGYLIEGGIEVRQYHSEGSCGMFEITADPLPPLQAADALIFTHDTIKSVFASHGLDATVHPKPFPENPPIVGSHMHLSISRPEHEEPFLAGLLEHWAALAAFYMPNYDSYERLHDMDWVWWGRGNKTAKINRIREGYWELRSPDGTANPYLALLAILTSGLLGLEAGTELSIKDPGRYIFEIPNEEAAEFGFIERMPRTLKKAIEKLAGDKLLVEAIGPEIMEKYLKVKTKEEANFSQMTSVQRREISMRTF